jgi:biopolymer transport protein ExbD
MPAMVGAFLLFLGSRFFLTVGMPIELPSGFPAIAEKIQAETAIAVRGMDNFVFGDYLLDGNGLESKLSAAIGKRTDIRRRTVVLHCDRRVPLEGLLRAAEIAKRCGFDCAQIAIAGSNE